MTNYLAIMMTVSSIICIRSKSQENLDKKKELWEYLKKKDHRVYWKIRHGILGETINLPGKSGRKISSMAYTVANRISEAILDILFKERKWKGWRLS